MIASNSYLFHYLLLEYHVSFMLFYLHPPPEEHNYGIKTKAIYMQCSGDMHETLTVTEQ